MTWDDFDGIEDSWSEDIPLGFDDDLPDPFYLGRADLLPSGELFVDVYADTPTGDYGRDRISFDDLERLLGIDEPDEQETWADQAGDLPFGFDQDDPDIRGPFPDEDSVNNFIDETGMYWADIYYDADHDEYFLDVSY